LPIVAILSAFAMPGFISWISKHKLGTGAREILSTIESARMRAVRENMSVGLEFQVPDNSGYRVFFDDGDGLYDMGEQLIHIGQMPGGVTISDASFGGPSSFRFDSQGFAFGTDNALTNGSVTITNTKDSRVIQITLAGNASIQNP
jgi:Tfp pilus assembly protein FimT